MLPGQSAEGEKSLCKDPVHLQRAHCENWLFTGLRSSRCWLRPSRGQVSGDRGVGCDPPGGRSQVIVQPVAV